MAGAVAAIDDPNFKASVAERARHKAYLDCWTATGAWQESAVDVPASRPSAS